MSHRKFRQHRPLFVPPVPKALKQPKVKWRVWPILWRAIKRTCMVLGAFVLISAIMGVFTASQVVKQQAVTVSAPDEMVLFLKFADTLQERPQSGGFSDPFAFTHPTVHDYIRAIDRAALDPRVKGIFARLEEGASFSLSQIQELRTALTGFKAAGKFAHIYVPSFGASMGGYYLASGFDQIWLQPMGVLSITGLNAEIPFLGGVMEDIGVEPQFLQRKAYKTAYESITNKDISPENREMTQALVGDIRTVMVGDITQDRGLETRKFESLVDYGLFTAEKAALSGLVSRVGYADMLVGDISEAIKGEREGHLDMFVDVQRYLSFSQHKDKTILSKTTPKVALVYAAGTIMPKAMGQGVAAAEDIAPAILQAADDPDIKAIVLRVDSPGGSPTASESILRAVQRAQKKGKPVIVSMGTVAASGGYWISAYADKIYTSPSTITGSIGVVGGKISLRELWSKLGVNWASVSWGDNAALWSMNSPYSAAEKARMDDMLDQVYDGFIARVAQGRNLPPARVEQIAQGRVWSGLKAVELGLADELGGLTAALDDAAQRAGAKDRRGVQIVTLPKPKTPLEQLMELLSQDGVVMSFKKRMTRIFAPFIPYIAMSQSPDPYMVYEPLVVR